MQEIEVPRHQFKNAHTVVVVSFHQAFQQTVALRAPPLREAL